MIYLLGDVYEDALYPAARLCRGLREVHHVLFSLETKSFLEGDLSEVLHIGFIAHEDGDNLCRAGRLDLVQPVEYVLEALSLCY